MGAHQHESKLAVYLVLQKESDVLLSRRAHTGYQDGNYSLIAGHLEGRESLKDAVVREAREEAGIYLAKEDLHLRHFVHRLTAEDRKIYLDFFFVANKWRGTPTNKEPQKCDDLSWFRVTELPKNIIPHVREALDSIASGRECEYKESGF